MTLAEFKAWFEGFTEGMDAAPNADQWERIKARVKEIDGTAISYPVFIDRYWPRRYRDVEPWQPYWSCTTAVSGTAMPTFDSSSAMMAVGAADRREIDHYTA